MNFNLSQGPRYLLLGLFCVFWISCAGPGAIPVPTEKFVEFATRNGQVTSLEALNRGRQLYLQRCSECHHLKKPMFLRPNEWPDMVSKMSKDGEIMPEEQLLITQYLVGASAAMEDSLERQKNRP